MSKLKYGQLVIIKDGFGDGPDEVGVYVGDSSVKGKILVNFYPNFHHCGLDPKDESIFVVDLDRVEKTKKTIIKKHNCNCDK